MVAPKDYIFFNPEGEKVIINNLHRFCLDCGLNHSNMNAVYHGARGSYLGWQRWAEGPAPELHYMAKTPEEKFHGNYECIPVTGCWIWTGHSRKGTYGDFRNKGKYIQAHRFSYELHNGAIPEGKLICHKCGVPSCVNPQHLYAGTHKENAQDKVRHARGEYDV